jgi:hypothetical protein
MRAHEASAQAPVALWPQGALGALERSFRELVAPAAGVATEEAARVGSLIVAENAGAADPDFDAVFARVLAAASADIAAFKRTPAGPARPSNSP